MTDEARKTAAQAASGLAPRDAAELAEAVRAHPRALEPIGGGSKRAIGKPVDADPLHLGAFSGIENYEPDELVVTVRAATPLAALEQALAGRGQRLAFEPPDLGALLGSAAPPTIGGVLAANLAGSRRVTAGAARDHFLGCAAVSGRGETFAAGGRVVKNVTGYDLPKLIAGSWGTFAVMTAVTLRVVPAAEAERTLAVACATAEAAVAVASAALGSPYDVSAAAFDPARGAVLLRLEGFAASVAARTAGLERLLGAEAAAGREIGAAAEAAASRALWAEVGAVRALARWPIVWRISVPPSEAPRVLAALEPERFLLDWGGGLIHAAFGSPARGDADASPDHDAGVGDDAGAPARVRGALRAGHATLFKAPLAVRAAWPVFQPQPPALAAAFARLKHAFDPDERLNPGRMS